MFRRLNHWLDDWCGALYLLVVLMPDLSREEGEPLP